MIGLIFQKDLILTKQMRQKSVIFVIIHTFQIKVLYIRNAKSYEF